MAQLPPGGTAFDGGDKVLWAKVQAGTEEHTDSHADGRHSYRVQWLVRVNSATATTADVRASKRIPAEGFAYFKHEVATDPLLLGTYMRPDPLAYVDTLATCVSRDVQREDDPYYFVVTVYYEAVSDPTAEPPQFAAAQVSYTENVLLDVTGRPVMNSAFDPIDGGMPTEGAYKRLTITRNLPWASWWSTRADNYRKTLNRDTFTYPGQVDNLAAAVTEPAGAVLIDDITEERVLLARGVGTANTYFWRISVSLLVDLQVIRRPDGTFTRRLHRWVVPDAGYHAFRDAGGGKVAKRECRASANGASSPQLLNGKGEELLPSNTLVDPIPFFPYVASGGIGGLLPDFYATPMGTTLTVADAEGVLVNDSNPTVTSVVEVDDPPSGSVTVNAGGGFTYTPAGGYVGWDYFTYKPTGAPDSQKQTVHVLVGAVPVLQWFDRYRLSNWADLGVLLEGW